MLPEHDISGPKAHHVMFIFDQLRDRLAMMLRRLILFATILSQVVWAADDALLKYLEPYPYYSSEIAIPQDLIERIRVVAPNATDTTLRQASLITWRFDRATSIRRRLKEGPEFFEPGIGPRPDGFFCTIRLFSNKLPSTDEIRHAKASVEKVVLDKERQEKRCRAVIPTKDASRFYAVDLEAGVDVGDELLSRIISIVSNYAGE